jgi:hypothetical protein
MILKVVNLEDMFGFLSSKVMGRVKIRVVDHILGLGAGF